MHMIQFGWCTSARTAPVASGTRLRRGSASLQPSRQPARHDALLESLNGCTYTYVYSIQTTLNPRSQMQR